LFFQVKTVAQLVELCGQVHQDMNDICVTLLYGYITRPGDFELAIMSSIHLRHVANILTKTNSRIGGWSDEG
jgi:hypothetical protein